MRTTVGWQAGTPDGSTPTPNPTPIPTLRRTPLQRRDLRPDDLAVRVDYCGVCHTDLHALRAGATDGKGPEPLVPGHEFTGVVTETGAAVTRFRAGDPVAVGNIVDSCGACAMCRIRPGELLPHLPHPDLRRHRPRRRLDHPRRLQPRVRAR
ncbi:L-threonine 3-dehydrogenase [Streptomyces violaceorubidus]